MPKRKKKWKPSATLLFYAWGTLSVMGLVLVGVQELTTPDSRTGQRVVRHESRPVAVADAAPVRLFKSKQVEPLPSPAKVNSLASYEYDDYLTELLPLIQAGYTFDKKGNPVRAK